jgi:hypothetical protein
MTIHLLYMRFIVPLSILIPLVFAILNYRFLDQSLKTIFWFLIFSGLANLVALYLATHQKNNLFVIHIYTVFEFAFISWYYKLQLKGIYNKIIPILIFAFTVLCVLNVLFIQKSTLFNTYTRSLGAIIIIGYCIISFNKQSLLDHDYSWGAISFNWINTGLLIYYTGCFFTFVFSNYLLSSSSLLNLIIWNIDNTFLLVEYILFGVAFYKCRKQPTISLY